MTRRCSIRFCHRYYMRARSRRSSSSLDPKCSLAGTTANRQLRAARECPREETPFAGVIHSACRFSCFPGEPVVGETASAGYTTPLVVTLWGPRARRRTLTCNHCHGVTEGPSSGALSAKRNAYRRARGAFHRVHRAWSCGLDWRPGGPSKKRIPMRPRIPFLPRDSPIRRDGRDLGSND